MKLYIGENLKKLREEKKVTQDTLAEYLGVTYQAVSRWENGAAYPDIELLPEIARFFGVSMEELMGCENSEREAERKAIMIANQRWDPNIDRKELLRELHELERQYPNNWEIKELICSTLTDPMPDNFEEFLPELRRYGRAVLERFRAFEEKDAKLFLWFCRTMVIAETEEEVEAWAKRLPWKVDLANQRDNVMKIRYQERKEWEKCRHYESEQILTYLRELTHRGPIPESEADIPHSCDFVNRYVEQIYDAVLGTPYSENGVPHNTIYLHERAENLFNHAGCLAGSWGWRGNAPDIEECFASLTRAVDYALLYGDSLKGEFFVCDNPYLEPQPVSEHMFMNVELKKNYLREKAVDWAIGRMTGTEYYEGVTMDDRFAALLQRLYAKKAELEEYWRNRD